MVGNKFPRNTILLKNLYKGVSKTIKNIPIMRYKTENNRIYT